MLLSACDYALVSVPEALYEQSQLRNNQFNSWSIELLIGTKMSLAKMSRNVQEYFMIGKLSYETAKLSMKTHKLIMGSYIGWGYSKMDLCYVTGRLTIENTKVSSSDQLP